MRVELSRDTHIEDMDGVRYLVTTSGANAYPWRGHGCQARILLDGDWETTCQSRWWMYREWRIPLTDVAPVYAYVEGEPCLCVVWSDYYQAYIVTCPATPDDEDSDDSTIICFARRAAIVCDTAEQFRALHAALKDVGCNHEWADARNEVITSGEICTKCHALRAGNDEPKETTNAEN